MRAAAAADSITTCGACDQHQAKSVCTAAGSTCARRFEFGCLWGVACTRVVSCTAGWVRVRSDTTLGARTAIRR